MVAKLGRESGKGATIDAVVGGVLGLLGGPAGVLWLAVSGWVIGGIAGHFADRSIPKAATPQMSQETKDENKQPPQS